MSSERNFIPKMKRYGDKGSPCLTPLEGLKIFVGWPFIRIASSEANKQERIMQISLGEC